MCVNNLTQFGLCQKPFIRLALCEIWSNLLKKAQLQALRTQSELSMQDRTSRYFTTFKAVGTIVLIAIALAIIYAAVISIKNWTGISV
ncbi:hypothetical protein SAMN05216386_0440 [Nitrosospira briensis]|uniref:Uncharacterized protein n=1 Tax=Nitrosospira briensis TaxID=35799 RepID=A0A1I4Y1X4_9PROT|nr:hypothetical protein SAMN05216386_0440 [Nitrosospira briensis]